MQNLCNASGLCKSCANEKSGRDLCKICARIWPAVASGPGPGCSTRAAIQTPAQRHAAHGKRCPGASQRDGDFDGGDGFRVVSRLARCPCAYARVYRGQAGAGHFGPACAFRQRHGGGRERTQRPYAFFPMNPARPRSTIPGAGNARHGSEAEHGGRFWWQGPNSQGSAMDMLTNCSQFCF